MKKSIKALAHKRLSSLSKIICPTRNLLWNRIILLFFRVLFFFKPRMCLTNIGCTLDYPLLWTWHFKWCGDAMIGLVILSWLTCVCVSPKIEASSARSGSARYCVRWNLRSSCCICSEEYMVRGFRIFFPLLLTRVSSPFSIDSLISPPASVNTVPSITYITKSITALTLLWHPIYLNHSKCRNFCRHQSNLGDF